MPEGGHSQDRPDPLPGWPAGIRRRAGLVGLLVLLIAADGLWFDGAIFRSALWQGLLWVLAAAGLAIGAAAYLRRPRDG